MKSIDTRGNFDIPEECRIPKEILENSCNLYKSDKACRYTMMDGRGFFCAKFTKFKKMLDDMVQTNQIKAKGDNCQGIGKEKSL